MTKFSLFVVATLLFIGLVTDVSSDPSPQFLCDFLNRVPADSPSIDVMTQILAQLNHPDPSHIGDYCHCADGLDGDIAVHLQALLAAHLSLPLNSFDINGGILPPVLDVVGQLLSFVLLSVGNLLGVLHLGNLNVLGLNVGGLLDGLAALLDGCGHGGLGDLGGGEGGLGGLVGLLGAVSGGDGGIGGITDGLGGLGGLTGGLGGLTGGLDGGLLNGLLGENGLVSGLLNGLLGGLGGLGGLR